MQVKQTDLLFALSSATFIENLNNNEIFPAKSHNRLPACSGLASSERCGEKELLIWSELNYNYRQFLYLYKDKI